MSYAYVILPIDDLVMKVVFVTTQVIVTESNAFVEERDPVAPVVVTADPKWINWLAFWAIVQPPAPSPETTIVSPTAAEDGRVKVHKPALFEVYPVFTTIEAEVPETTTQESPDPVALIVIVLFPLAILIPVPPLSVAAAGVVVPPMTSCPEERESAARTPVPEVLEMITPLVLKETAPVPPPATTAVVYEGFAEEPPETRGIPDVADGATEVIPFEAAPTRV